ncbi:MAG: ABC transporter substrate-binding protein [Dehalococcoidales bacterium]|nr:ABC transporter substrate-binding protein [Dehalococcoidales bacterium]
MTKKIVWLLVSAVMVLSLVMTSCSTDSTKETKVETEKDSDTVKITESETATAIKGETKTEVTKEVIEEKGLRDPAEPKYGGIYNFVALSDYRGWDPVLQLTMDCTAQHYIGGYPMMGDWTKGYAGSKEIMWIGGFAGRGDVWAGNFAESWEIVDNSKIIFHVRQGVYFDSRAPTNGREMDASDFEYSMNRSWFEPSAYHGHSVDPDAVPTKIYAVDKWTCIMEVPPKQIGVIWLLTGAMSWIYPHEVIDMYGDMLDWQNLRGAGPFYLNDYIPASLISYKRNDNYWQTDPYNPENQLPYVDGLKSLVIEDSSTRQAAFRTGQVDRLGGVSWEDGELLKKQNSNLLYITGYGSCQFPCMRVDKPELPISDIKVRQAMNMAVNKQEMIDDYYEGNAVIIGWPFNPSTDFSPWYVPLEEQPQAVKDLYTYDPEKAKKLLAEAGYADGFKTKIQCISSDADFLSIVKDYLYKVGIDMEIEPLESGAFYNISRGRGHDEMIYKFWTNHWPARFLDVRQESFDNHAYFESTITRNWYNDIMGHYFDANYINPILKEYGSFVLEQALGIYLPVPYNYHLWWPWLQNYHGEGNMGFVQPEFFIYYSWLDTEMKKEMGY